MASLWMKIFIKVAHNEYFEFPLYCKIVNFVIFFTWSLLKSCHFSRAQFNAHIFSCSTTFISFHSSNTPKCAMPGGGTSTKGIADHGQIKNQFNWWPQTELRVCHGHKDFLSGHESNESVCRRYCLPHRDANSVALWKLMFYIYCSHPMEANRP